MQDSRRLQSCSLQFKISLSSTLKRCTCLHVHDPQAPAVKLGVTQDMNERAGLLVAHLSLALRACAKLGDLSPMMHQDLKPAHILFSCKIRLNLYVVLHLVDLQYRHLRHQVLLLCNCPSHASCIMFALGLGVACWLGNVSRVGTV